MKTPKIIFSIKLMSPEMVKPVIIREITGAFETSFFLEEKCNILLSTQKLYKMKKETTYKINNLSYINYLSSRFIGENLLDAHVIIQRN